MMKIDQTQPGPWIGAGAVVLVLGLLVTGIESDAGLGRVLLVAGGILVVVGLVIFAVRAGTNGSRDG